MNVLQFGILTMFLIMSPAVQLDFIDGNLITDLRHCLKLTILFIQCRIELLQMRIVQIHPMKVLVEQICPDTFTIPPVSVVKYFSMADA